MFHGLARNFAAPIVYTTMYNDTRQATAEKILQKVNQPVEGLRSLFYKRSNQQYPSSLDIFSLCFKLSLDLRKL